MGSKLVYVNAYSVGRCYGGPEEGGWWFDAGTPLASVPVSADGPEEKIEAEIEAVKADLSARLGWPLEPAQGRYSAIGEDDFEIYIEEAFASPFPAERPHYE